MMLTPTTARALPRLGALGTPGLQLQSAFVARNSQSPLAALSRINTSPNQTLCTSAQQQQLSRASPISQTSIANTTRRSASTAAPSSSPAAQLDWNGFFDLRKTRRRFQLVSSTLTTIIGGTGGAMLVVSQNFESLLGMVPLDPLVSVGLFTMCFAGLGWLAGPSLGNGLFYMVKSGVKAPMNHKEAEFFARIKKNRVDPTTSSVQNPVPDFYGEKISSVKGYRSWLKDQRAFNKKRTMV